MFRVQGWVIFRFFGGYIGIMGEKKMETTILALGFRVLVMLGLFGGYIGRMEKNMETTI